MPLFCGYGERVITIYAWDDEESVEGASAVNVESSMYDEAYKATEDEYGSF